jgi:hypothetical protein
MFPYYLFHNPSNIHFQVIVASYYFSIERHPWPFFSTVHSFVEAPRDK